MLHLDASNGTEAFETETELTRWGRSGRLQFYGLFKQAKEGDNVKPKPGCVVFLLLSKAKLGLTRQPLRHVLLCCSSSAAFSRIVSLSTQLDFEQRDGLCRQVQVVRSWPSSSGSPSSGFSVLPTT